MIQKDRLIQLWSIGIALILGKMGTSNGRLGKKVLPGSFCKPVE